ncbi:hypothetical protein Mapa_015825 [Marchantia paleacea]|nr:hypothetical protein Mapa_015825 [Marchantia paleacea]
MEKVQIRSLSAICVTIVALVMLAFYNWTVIHDQFFYTVASMQEIHLPGPGARYVEQPKTPQELIERLRNTTRRIGLGTIYGINISGAELEDWKAANPCLSRSELIPMYAERKGAKFLPPNPIWDELFAEYSRYHRVCTKSIRNPKGYFAKKDASSVCKFLVADVAFGTGLGNKMFTLASGILYAIITQRVLLVPTTNLVPEITCEPFPGSSWRLDPETFPTPPEQFVTGDSSWILDTEFFDRVDRMMKIVPNANGTASLGPLAYAVGVKRHEWQPKGRFYCDTEQRTYSQSTWMYTSGCIYTIPKLFAIPSFRPVLEGLFPDRMAMTRVVRSLLLPDNTVWDRVRRLQHVYLSGADRQLGLQVRYRDGREMYTKMNNIVNKRITDCAHHNGLLPRLTSELNSKLLSATNTSAPNPVVKVFIASLFPGVHESLSKLYVRNPSVSGEDVGLVQITQDETQEFSVEADRQAFTEVILLSLSDHLIVTPMSTFGGLAQSFGALTPWFIDYRSESSTPCERSPTVEVCNQYSIKSYSCPHDSDVNGQRFDQLIDYIKDCPVIDHDLGIQLITDFES